MMRRVIAVWFLSAVWTAGLGQADDVASPAEVNSSSFGAPSYDHYSETTHRQLTWDDFKGIHGHRPPGWSRWSEGSFAHVFTSIKYTRLEIRVDQLDDEDDGNGEVWAAWVPEYRAFGHLDKNLSAVRDGARNNATLAHEQLHFDIAELFARRMSVRFLGLCALSSDRNEARNLLRAEIQKIKRELTAEVWDVQGSYDAQAGHGVRKRAQKRWTKNIWEQFSQTTAELAAAVDRGRPECPRQ